MQEQWLDGQEVNMDFVTRVLHLVVVHFFEHLVNKLDKKCVGHNVNRM